MKDNRSKNDPELMESSNKAPKQQTEPETIPAAPVEVGGPKGPEPTRYGDWEKAGRCTDF